MELTSKFDLKEIERLAKEHVSKIDLQKMIDDSSDKREKIMFIEGPPTLNGCLLYTSPSPRDLSTSRMPSSA